MHNLNEPAPGSLHNAALHRVVEVYRRAFNDRPEGREFLAQCGINDAQLWGRCQLGYADGSLERLLPRQGGVRDDLVALGVLDADGKERFAGQIVVPVWNADGHLVNLWGRALDAAAPESGLPDRPLGAWNLGAVKVHSRVFLVGSLLDAWAAQVGGHLNVIALPPSFELPEELPEALRTHSVLQVTVLCGDPCAGEKTVQAVKTVAPSLACQSRSLPQPLHTVLVAHDAAWLKQWLAEGLFAPQKTAIPVQPDPSRFTLRLGVRDYVIQGLEKGPRQLRATVSVEHAGRSHVDTLDLYAARSRRHFCQDLARVFEEPAGVLEAELARLAAVCDESASKASAAGKTHAKPVVAPDARAAAETFGQRRDLVEAILQDYDRCGLVGERANKLLCYLALTSRKLDHPLAVLIQSSSGAGKTALQDATLRFCPPEDLVKVTSLSARALFYRPPDDLRHKVLAIEEGEGVQPCAYALRTLISAGALSAQVASKDGAGARFTTIDARVEGPVAVFLTTAEPEVDPETRSRFWVTSMNEGQSQTQAILAHQREQQTLSGLARVTALEEVFHRHWTFQRLLRPLAVVNPYADQLAFGDGRLQSRRDQPRYLNLIRAIALLRQMQKLVKSTSLGGRKFDYVEADLEDIRMANELAAQLLGHTLDELSGPALDLLMHLEKLAPGFASAFTRQEVRARTGWSYARLHRYLQELLRLEFVVPESAKPGSARTYRLLYRGEGKEGHTFALGLRRVEELQPACTPFAPALQGVCTGPSSTDVPQTERSVA